MILIPAPTDSYDHDSSTRANLASITALMSAFDASMDSLNDAIDAEMKRLDAIQSRSTIGDPVKTTGRDISTTTTTGTTTTCATITKIICPSTLEEALDDHTNHTDPSSFLSNAYKAHQIASAKILSILKQEAQTMETTPNQPLPSDEWLDRASAFQLKQVCSSAKDKNRVPPLFISKENSLGDINTRGRGCVNSVIRQEAEYYKEAKKRNEISKVKVKVKQDKEEDDMDQSVMSGRRTVYSTMGNHSVASYATQGTAAFRRRQRKAHAVTTRRTNGNGQGGDVGETGGLASPSNISTSRQQLVTGSLPFVCEMIHDTHGLGTMDGSGVFSPVEHVCDLFYHGTSTMAFRVEGYQKNGGSSDADEGTGAMVKKGNGLIAGGTGRKMNVINSSELYNLAECMNSSFSG